MVEVVVYEVLLNDCMAKVKDHLKIQSVMVGRSAGAVGQTDGQSVGWLVNQSVSPIILQAG